MAARPAVVIRRLPPSYPLVFGGLVRAVRTIQPAIYPSFDPLSHSCASIQLAIALVITFLITVFAAVLLWQANALAAMIDANNHHDHDDDLARDHTSNTTNAAPPRTAPDHMDMEPEPVPPLSVPPPERANNGTAASSGSMPFVLSSTALTVFFSIVAWIGGVLSLGTILSLAHTHTRGRLSFSLPAQIRVPS